MFSGNLGPCRIDPLMLTSGVSINQCIQGFFWGEGGVGVGE